MKDAILRWFYLRFAPKFEQFMVDDYVKNIPEQVRDDGFTVMSAQKHKLKRLTNYLAYSLHQKMASDVKNSARYQGMFIQLKIMDSMIAGRPDPVDNGQDPLKTEKPNKFQEHLTAATSFAKDAINKRRG